MKGQVLRPSSARATSPITEGPRSILGGAPATSTENARDHGLRTVVRGEMKMIHEQCRTPQQ